MAAELSDFDRQGFAERLAAVSPSPLGDAALDALYAHYRELRRWSPALSLVGPAAAADPIARLYGESLAALRLLPDSASKLLDVGSGAGFPGLVLAAARGELLVTLVEPRERRWAFLEAASRRAGLADRCRCLHGRLEVPLDAALPGSLDVVTVRALRLPPSTLDALAGRLAPGGRVLLWVGERAPELPPSLRRTREVVTAPGQRVVELVPS